MATAAAATVKGDGETDRLAADRLAATFAAEALMLCTSCGGAAHWLPSAQAVWAGAERALATQHGLLESLYGAAAMGGGQLWPLLQSLFTALLGAAEVCTEVCACANHCNRDSLLCSREAPNLTNHVRSCSLLIWPTGSWRWPPLVVPARCCCGRPSSPTTSAPGRWSLRQHAPCALGDYRTTSARLKLRSAPPCSR